MRKKVLLFLIAILALVSFTGCGTKNDGGTEVNNNEGGTEISTSKSKCKIVECMDLLPLDVTLEEANKIIGFEGEKFLEGDSWVSYRWNLNDDDTVEITFYDTWNNIKINFPSRNMKNNKVDFSRYEEISSAMKKGERLSYDKVKEIVGGEEGILVEKSESNLKYEWVNADGGYLNASFNETKSVCTFVSGWF